MSIKLTGLTKRFGAFNAVDGVDLTIADGELMALLGPSGSGKTTLLRMIAGLEQPDAGQLSLGGADATLTPPQARAVGFVFQHYALFRHMTVFENVAFGLRVRRRQPRLAEPEIRRRVGELLAMVQLEQMAGRYPNQLSGGQRQRVALARALATEPRVLLLDEPFGALDAKVRHELRRFLHELQQRTGITTVFVTHDQEEAMELADRVAVMHRGRLEQVGPPGSVYDHPATPFACEFLGAANRLAASVTQGRAVVDGAPVAILNPPLADGPATAFIRPRDLLLAPADGAPAEGGGASTLTAEITALRAIGPRLRIELRYRGQPLEAELEREETLPDWARPGARVALTLRRATLFPA